MHTRQAVRCWECEATTEHLATVTLRTSEHHVTHVALCLRCFDACYRPLASPDDATRRELVFARPGVAG